VHDSMPIAVPRPVRSRAGSEDRRRYRRPERIAGDADESKAPCRAMTEPQKRVIAEKIRLLVEEALAMESPGQRRCVPGFAASSFAAPAVAR
jgi:hypothetical protein